MSTLHPEHEIFDRDYQPPRVDKNGEAIDAPMIADPFGFFVNMPVTTDFKGKRCLNLLPPAVKEQIKLDNLNARLKKAAEQVEKQKQKIKDQADNASASSQ